MKTKLEKTLKTAAAIIFVAALGLNIIATLDGPAIYSDAIAQETGGTGDTGDTGGTGDTNYSYARELRVDPVYDTIVQTSCGAKFWIKYVPVGVEYEITTLDDPVAQKKYCDTWLLARCDQNKVGIFPINLNGTN